MILQTFEGKLRPNKMEAEAVFFLLAALTLPVENSRFRSLLQIN